ncbi:MAG: FtsX-like permease family protein [Psychrobacillus sp.]|uniref:FtsX-like permease family protein n=1 Tax=Solibacillus isronensis B3W22 TaxID=1224748 RepID=K1L2A3_9BACL|nr:FtsX-like permease family protein [Solibacillus isronensis]AMO85172.1 hypothetical protein SOLI23_06105 [Solibacillus silvestris]EKB44743.1 hypothetical protein B857_02370 [Solibacillus isronensis B3W22]
MNQFILALSDLWRRKINSIFLFIQVTLFLILLNFAIMALQDLENMKAEVNRLNKDEQIYSLIDVTNQAQIDQLLSDESRIEDLQSLYTYMFNNTANNAFTLYSSYLSFNDHNLQQVPTLAHPDSRTSNVRYLYVNEYFFKYFDMDLAEGHYFNHEDYTSNSEIIPVILGYNYKDILNISDTFEDISGTTYKVAGFLKENMNYIDIMATREFINLNNMMLIPLNENKLVSNTDYDAVINRAYIIPEAESVLADIVNYAADLNTYSFAYKSMNEQIEYVIMDKEKWIQTQLFLTVLVALFTIVSFIVTFLQFIEQNMYEFGVHYLNGATNKDIMMRIVFQVVPFIVVGDIVSLTFSGFNHSGWLTILASILLLIIVCIIPVLKIYRLEVTSILRWGVR